jgi:hypothetical protein
LGGRGGWFRGTLGGVADAGLHRFDQQVEGLLEEALARGEGGYGGHSCRSGHTTNKGDWQEEFSSDRDFYLVERAYVWAGGYGGGLRDAARQFSARCTVF